VKSIIPPAAIAAPAPIVRAATVATVAAKNRIIHSPSKKIDSTGFTGHICGHFATHGAVRTALSGDWCARRSTPASAVKTVLAKPSDRGGGQGSNAGYWLDENGEQ
jgi:hypothetical protein